jgi:SAM-dependent methyltransferase
MTCPLCNHSISRTSWFGSVFYQGIEFPYVECLSCLSLFCSNMPDDKTLAKMYGPRYSESFDVDPTITDPKETYRVMDWLKKSKPGLFVDYGCGTGDLLIEAAKLNWQSLGVEFSSEVAETVQNRTGIKVVNRFDKMLEEPIADILHLGDVLEHLTDLNNQFLEILKILKPGGVLLAQGPLEGNACLFTLGLRLFKLLNKSRRTEMAPYHVILASSKGQSELFNRFGLKELEYIMSEVTWPAPSRLSISHLKQPRSVGLFLLRRLSQGVSILRPNKWGNRYFYAGLWNGFKT